MRHTTEDRERMRECLRLACRGAGRVSPNPLVGCVIVRAGEVVARGWHRRYGGAHAEVDALRRAGSAAMGSTLYVNLEPCNHEGKTPPCTGAIIRAGVARVVFGARDPNPLVRGGGARALREAGVEVTPGVERAEAEELNRRYLHFITTGLPYVTVKLAQSLDGKIAARRGGRTRISGPDADRYVHRLRAEVDAVLVGAGTMRIDRPRLTVRHVRGRNPARIVLDTHLSAPYGAAFLRDDAPRIVFIAARAMKGKNVRALLARGVAVIASPTIDGKIDLSFMLRELARRGFASVLVEGGSELATRVLASRRAQELQLIVAPTLLGDGVPTFGAIPRAPRPRALSAEQLGRDVLIIARFAGG